MCRLDRGEYEKIKEGQEIKQTERIVKFVEGRNTDSLTQMKSEGAT